jgi:hypothetical protein
MALNSHSNYTRQMSATDTNRSLFKTIAMPFDSVMACQGMIIYSTGSKRRYEQQRSNRK